MDIKNKHGAVENQTRIFLNPINGTFVLLIHYSLPRSHVVSSHYKEKRKTWMNFLVHYFDKWCDRASVSVCFFMLQKISLTTKIPWARLSPLGAWQFSSMLTHSKQFHALILEFFWRCLNIILWFSVSDENADFSSSRPHASLGLEALLANEIQSHA